MQNESEFIKDFKSKVYMATYVTDPELLTHLLDTIVSKITQIEQERDEAKQDLDVLDVNRKNVYIYIFYDRSDNRNRHVIKANCKADAEKIFMTLNSFNWYFISCLGIDNGLSDEAYLEEDKKQLDRIREYFLYN